MKILHLTLKKKWFDMIASGDKKEEYREPKGYWQDRLGEDENGNFYEIVQFRNGYRKNSPVMRFRIDDEITLAYGNPEWGAEPGKKYFVIKLGEPL